MEVSVGMVTSTILWQIEDQAMLFVFFECVTVAVKELALLMNLELSMR